MGNKVAYIAALDYEHHIFITEWAKAFPSAKLLGVEGLAEKREKDQATAGSQFHHVWKKNTASIKVDSDFDQEFEHEYVGSHANKELVFLHKPDRTLIEAEYVFLQFTSPLLYSIWSLDIYLEYTCCRTVLPSSRSSHEHEILTAGFGCSMMFNLPANEQFSHQELYWTTKYNRTCDMAEEVSLAYSKRRGSSRFQSECEENCQLGLRQNNSVSRRRDRKRWKRHLQKGIRLASERFKQVSDKEDSVSKTLGVTGQGTSGACR